jgi:hypothetical protein
LLLKNSAKIKNQNQNNFTLGGSSGASVKSEEKARSGGMMVSGSMLVDLDRGICASNKSADICEKEILP